MERERRVWRADSRQAGGIRRETDAGFLSETQLGVDVNQRSEIDCNVEGRFKDGNVQCQSAWEVWTRA